jgi:ArsR family transcriptional regulator
MANKDYSIRQEQLARFAKAMGHPARIAILQFLAKQETCYFGDIHEELPIAKATVSQHLKELKGNRSNRKRKVCETEWEILKCQTKEDIGQNKRYTERET